MPHILHALGSLKGSKYVPAKFDPISSESFELFFSGLALEELETTTIDKSHLSRLAYITFMLGQSFNVPSISVHWDASKAMSQYQKIALKKGYCDPNGSYFTAKLNPSEHILRSITNPHVKGVPNFLRAWFLIMLANTLVLPKILNSMQDKLPIADYHTNLVEYYSHISNVFIPNLFNALARHQINNSVKILLHLSKLLLEFPSQILPSTTMYTKKLNGYAVNNLSSLDIDELLSILQLNEYLEICHNVHVLSEEDKVLMANFIVSNSSLLRPEQLLMIMRLKFTVLNRQHLILLALDDKFSSCISAEQSKFNKVLPFQHELDFFHAIRQQMYKSDRKFIHHSYVCPQTGKEIDIAFIKGKRKVAIHIDGTGTHYYLDRKELNRKTRARNKALENSGWVNVEQQLPRIPCVFELRTHIHLVKETQELLCKLRTVLPFKGVAFNTSQPLVAPLLFRAQQDGSTHISPKIQNVAGRLEPRF